MPPHRATAGATRSRHRAALHAWQGLIYKESEETISVVKVSCPNKGLCFGGSEQRPGGRSFAYPAASCGCGSDRGPRAWRWQSDLIHGSPATNGE